MSDNVGVLEGNLDGADVGGMITPVDDTALKNGTALNFKPQKVTAASLVKDQENPL